jgi:hypothetical protein
MDSVIVKDVIPHILCKLSIKDLISYSKTSKSSKEASDYAWKLKLKSEIVPSKFKKIESNVDNKEQSWFSAYVKHKCNSIKMMMLFTMKMVMDRNKYDVGFSVNRYKWSVILFQKLAEADNWWLINNHKSFQKFLPVIHNKLKVFGKIKDNKYHQLIYNEFKWMLPPISYEGIDKLFE